MRKSTNPNANPVEPMNVHRLQRRASVLQVLAVLAGVCLVGVGLVVLLVYRTITVGGDIRAVRGVLLKDLGVKCASKVEIRAQPWVVGLTRLGLSFAPLEPELANECSTFG